MIYLKYVELKKIFFFSNVVSSLRIFMFFFSNFPKNFVAWKVQKSKFLPNFVKLFIFFRFSQSFCVALKIVISLNNVHWIFIATSIILLIFLWLIWYFVFCFFDFMVHHCDIVIDAATITIYIYFFFCNFFVHIVWHI